MRFMTTLVLKQKLAKTENIGQYDFPYWPILLDTGSLLSFLSIWSGAYWYII